MKLLLHNFWVIQGRRPRHETRLFKQPDVAYKPNMKELGEGIYGGWQQMDKVGQTGGSWGSYQQLSGLIHQIFFCF